MTYIETIWSYIPYIVIFWCSCDIRTGHLLTGTFPVNKFFMTRTILINNSILTLYEMFFWESKRNLFHSAHVKCVFELVKLSQVDVWEKVCISNFNFTHIFSYNIRYVCQDTSMFKRPPSHQIHVSIDLNRSHAWQCVS